MKTLTLIIAVLIASISITFASENDTINEFPNKLNLKNQAVGGYANIKEYTSNSPSYDFKFKARKRLFAEVLFLGGNDYKIARRSLNISKKTVRHEIWGVWDGKYFYINNIKYTKVGKYIRLVPLDGKYYFTAAQSRKGDVVKWLTGSGLILGGIPGAINTTKRIAFEVDPTNNTISVISTKDMERILGDDEDLFNSYSNKKKNYKAKVMLEYIDKRYQKIQEQ